MAKLMQYSRNLKFPLVNFAGRIIDLGILVFSDYPRIVHSSIHVKTSPQLFEKSDTVPGVRNIIDSGLGPDWKYWSFSFIATAEDTALNLMSQINGVFKRV
jgi:hypothetical protein